MVIRRAAPVVLLLSLLAAGCANGPANSTQPGAAPASASPSPTPSEVVDVPLPGSKKPAGGTTITGTVSAGVEPNCLLLQGDTGSHLLIFDEPSLRSLTKVGDKVTVTGRADPDMMSTCQQGTPFVVSAVRPG